MLRKCLCHSGMATRRWAYTEKQLVPNNAKGESMKRFIVEQSGFVQVEAGRRFIVEVPDHINEEK